MRYLKIAYSLTPNLPAIKGIVSIGLVVFLLVAFALWYWYRKRNADPSKAPTGLVLVVDLTLYSLQKIVTNLLGQRFRFLTPYAFLLLSYINLSNLLGLLGLENPMNFLVVPLLLGFITFLGIHFFGIVFRRWRYFKKFLNPLELIMQFAPFISISFRLFGNLMAGSFILFLFYQYTTIELLGAELRYFNLLAVFAAPFHLYFDFFSGAIQSFIFTILTFTYWSFERPDSSYETEKGQPFQPAKLYNEDLREKKIPNYKIEKRS